MIATWLLVLMSVAALAMALAFLRVVLGPTLADRVAALDLLTTAGLGLLTLLAIRNDAPVYLDVGIVLALVSFVGTIAFARYIEEDLRS